MDSHCSIFHVYFFPGDHHRARKHRCADGGRAGCPLRGQARQQARTQVIQRLLRQSRAGVQGTLP